MDRRPADFRGGALAIGGDRVVGRLGFGAMRLTGPGIWGEPRDRGAAARVLRRVVDLGLTLIDTADSYGPHVSEQLLAEVLYPYPEGLLIATKGGLTRPAAARWDRNGRPDHLREACEGSLKRLRVERIDLYQLHAPDPEVPLEESLGALADLRAQGKIRHIGVSNVSVDELRRACAVVAVASVQNRYNVGDRRHDPVLEECERRGIAFLPWHPLAEGDADAAVIARLVRRRAATPPQIALAWLLARSPVIAPIPGTASLAHLEENVAAADIVLTPEDMAELS